MICSHESFVDENFLEYLRDIDDLRPWVFSWRKSLWPFPGYWWFEAKTFFQAKQSLNSSGILMICGLDKFPGKKVCEFFRDIDDLRLRQFCRWKLSWISWTPRYRWFVAERYFLAKNSLTISGVLMICVLDSFACEESFEYFRDIDDLQLRKLCRWKFPWITPRFRWFPAVRFFLAKKSLTVSGILMIRGKDIFPGKTVFELVRDFDDLRLRQIFRRKSLWNFRDFDNLRSRQICRRERFWIVQREIIIWGHDNLTGKKVFECFREVDDFWLRDFSMRKCLWSIMRGWCFAVKTNLQSERSLKISELIKICG